VNEASPATGTRKSFTGVERVGSKMPHPVVIFVMLIGLG